MAGFSNSGNASQIQSVPVSTTVPTSAQELVYDSITATYIPTNQIMPSIGIPAMHGFLAWTNDPAVTSVQATALTAGTPMYEMIYLQQGQVLSNISVVVQTVGATVANSYLALYNTTTQLAVTPAITTAFQAVGIVKTAFVAPYTVPTTGFYFVALLIGNGTLTAPRFMAGPVVNGTVIAGNVGLTPTLNTLTLRFGANGTALTTLPNPYAGTQSSNVVWAFWAGLN